MYEKQDWKELNGDLNNLYGLSLEETAPIAQLEEGLSQKINEMIQSDFAGLIRILYRIDINESKLRQLLQGNNSGDAGLVLARLMIERQLQKIESRRLFKSNNTESNEEKW